MEDIEKAVRAKAASNIEQVDALPEKAVLNKVIFNKEDKSFYLGVEDKED